MSVVKVGGGRGFIVEDPACVERRLVVTAGHCLPHLPEAHPFEAFDRVYQNLLGALGAEPMVWAECLFVDPIADMAVLRTPDNQTFYEQADAFEALTENRPGLSMAHVKSGPGWFLSLDGKWTSIRLESRAWTYLEIDPTEFGQSGSPILNEHGEAVGVVSAGTESNGKNQRCGSQPILSRNLPAWLARAVRSVQ
jgi:hypothetical protein